ncbi:unnamed protein product [Thlaspi arvense]|uniref:Uncharacterized protein n=1 Tax=Thlaspi arvense TaxID=13288 RepID=A0AAU9RKG2_THLAR|nr:unnamed protein product [Thlaspi arvense]
MKLVFTFQMSYRRLVKRALIMDDDEDEDTVYSFKVLLPNSTSVPLKVTNPDQEMPMEKFVNLVKEEYDKARKDCVLMSKRTKVDWNLGRKFHLESNGGKMKGMVRFAAFEPNVCHIIRLDDGSGKTSTMYENLWDLTPDTDLLKELPENYSLETALADLIDNSLQAVWPCSGEDGNGDRRLISVEVSGDRISVFDTGRGMDSSDENAIDKWGKIGGSLHRSQKTFAIGGKPPYLKPYFGMFGYGGPYACMFLGRHTLVSSKTKESKKVFTLEYKKEALIDNRSISGKHWKTGGGMRDPSEEEIKLSPHGSFTKVEIFDTEFDVSKIYQLQCRLKDIYFPYIQCDELSNTRRTERPVEFQVNGEDLAGIIGGEVAITNLNSRGQEFSFQIRFTLSSEKTEKRKGTPQEANARLKFVYFPIIRGKESIEKILEGLEEEGCKVSESFQTFGRVSIRRLGRLLPEVRWDSIPFMQRGAIASTLQKCCQRVKCFVDLDAGFSPTPSKTDLASQNPFSVALKKFGSKFTEKDTTDVKTVIHREGKPLSIAHLEQTYQDWVMKMHDTHDEEATSGEDEATLIVESLDKKALGILRDAVRVHKEVARKGMSWKRGQKIKILRGAYAGVHSHNVYATIDYFLIEGFEDEVGGDTRILCRPINIPENEGCTLSIIDGISRLELKRSLSLPITIIDSEKCLPADADEWNRQLEKQQEKAPSKIDLLEERECRELNIDGELPVGESVRVGRAPPQQIVAVVRPACFRSLTPSKKLDQKHIVKMEEKEMVMVVKLQDSNMKSSDKSAKPVCSQRVFPTSCKGISGLYIFALGSRCPDLFKKAGTYEFSFSIGDSLRCKETVVVRPSSVAAKWKLEDNLESLLCNVRVGSSLPPFRIACFDEYENQILFTSIPSLEVELKANPGFELKIDNIEANLIKKSSILIIENILVETDELDQIRPNYDATLEIRAIDKPFSVLVACKVNPGPLKRVEVNNPQALENLLPGSTVEDFILELFDGYNNHVAEGTDVLLHIDGYCIADWMDVNRKVNDRGCTDLSGILKVTKSYGKSVSFSVMSGNEEIFRKESQIEERELRLVTELPESCIAGSNLTNLIFQVTDSDGTTDDSIHDDEKSGCSHTMSIESDSRNIQRGIRYAFERGSCKVPSLSLPENEVVFSFRVFHSRYPELHVNLEIPLTPAPTFERDDIGCSTPYSRTTTTPQSGMASTTSLGETPTPNIGVEQTPCSQFGVLAIRTSSMDRSSQNELIDVVQYTQSLKHKLDVYETQQVEIDERLNWLEAEQEQAEQELITLEASLEPISAALPECLSTRESMMKQIEVKHHDTLASVFCSLYREVPTPQSLLLSNKGVFGIVALLGSVASTSLSRALSVYLGKDTMLALVCKSSQFGPRSAEYLRLESEAARLGRSITNPLLILCLDDTSPWNGGLVRNDPQRKLAMVDPELPSGDPIPGFKGYAVNMIELALEDLEIQTKWDHGIRETLFYGLFGDLQVYETGKDLEAALPYINGADAVSLDGWISKKNGFIYSGYCKPEIHFPITVTEKEEKALIKLEITRDRKRKAEEMIVEKNVKSSSVVNIIICMTACIIRVFAFQMSNQRNVSKVGCWNLGEMFLNSTTVRVGSFLPPCCVACFDEYGNQIPFTSVPSLEVKLKTSPGFELRIDEIEANLIGPGILQVENLLVEAGWLDHIRPDYNATLEICSNDGPFTVSVACNVKPGPIKRVVEKNPRAMRNLLPDSTIENYILEVYDGYNNHAAEGTDALIYIDGCCIQDSVGSLRKVDGNGCIDLSGIFKVTAGYGKPVSLTVMHANEEIFTKVSLVEKRDLVLSTEPEYCGECLTLTELIFKVTEPDGSVDTTIHHDENSGSFHTMRLESSSSTFESGVTYAFVHGSCKVPSLSLPETDGVSSFRAFHSQHPEIYVSFKILVTPDETLESDEIGSSEPQSKIDSTTNQRLTPTQQTLSTQTVSLDMAQYTEILKGKLNSYKERAEEVVERLKCLEAEQQLAQKELSILQASLGPLGTVFPECLSTKEAMMKHIEEKHNQTAASVFCSIYRNAPPPQSFFMAKKGVFGLVALLASVPSTSLSRVLSEYLGEDTMLALVRKSSLPIPNSSEYLRLRSEAAKLGRTITKRFQVLCLDEMRPWMDGVLVNDTQRKLAMEDPKLPGGDPIPGFKGYAVNMIELAPDVLKPEIHFPITVRENEEWKLREWEAAREKVRMVEKKIAEERCLLRKLEEKMNKNKERFDDAEDRVRRVDNPFASVDQTRIDLMPEGSSSQRSRGGRTIKPTLKVREMLMAEGQGREKRGRGAGRG